VELRLANPSSSNWVNVTGRCPICMKLGSFDAILDFKDIVFNDVDKQQRYTIGLRTCPDIVCKGLIYFIQENTNNTFNFYPPELIDFDSKGIPQEIVSTFEEALKCHADECYRAAAMMIRRTIEELCKIQGATGGNLKDRIKNLGGKIIVPQALLDGIDNLRLLGNDAAHIESQDFNKVGREEVEVGVILTKEFLKSIYQYEHLIKHLEGLKKP